MGTVGVGAGGVGVGGVGVGGVGVGDGGWIPFIDKLYKNNYFLILPEQDHLGQQGAFTQAILVSSLHCSYLLHQILQSLGPQLLISTGTSVVVGVDVVGVGVDGDVVVLVVVVLVVVVSSVVVFSVVGFLHSTFAIESFPFPFVIVMLRRNVHGGFLFLIS